MHRNYVSVQACPGFTERKWRPVTMTAGTQSHAWVAARPGAVGMVSCTERASVLPCTIAAARLTGRPRARAQASRDDAVIDIPAEARGRAAVPDVRPAPGPRKPLAPAVFWAVATLLGVLYIMALLCLCAYAPTHFTVLLAQRTSMVRARPRPRVSPRRVKGLCCPRSGPCCCRHSWCFAQSLYGSWNTMCAHAFICHVPCCVSIVGQGSPLCARATVGGAAGHPGRVAGVRRAADAGHGRDQAPGTAAAERAPADPAVQRRVCALVAGAAPGGHREPAVCRPAARHAGARLVVPHAGASRGRPRPCTTCGPCATASDTGCLHAGGRIDRYPRTGTYAKEVDCLQELPELHGHQTVPQTGAPAR